MVLRVLRVFVLTSVPPVAPAIILSPMSHDIASSQLARIVVESLQRAGFIAYFAGGCVRDRLMGLPPKDYDVATSATPQQVLAVFPRSKKIGIAFGVVQVADRKATVEVATFRADGDYLDGRRPEGVTFTTPEGDSQRRDFTCNGLFYDPVKDELLDFVGGKRDIDAKLLRAIGDPRQRFAEDHLRMLRAVRFAAKLNFTIEPATHAAILELQDHIQNISRERIGDEVRNILEHPARVPGIQLLSAYPRLFCNLFFVAPERIVRPVEWTRLSRLAEPVPRVLGLMALLLDIWGPTGKDISTVTDKLRASLMLSNDETAAFAWWADHLAPVHQWPSLSVARFKRMMADPHWADLARLYLAGPVDDAARAAFLQKTAVLEAEGVAPQPLISGLDLIRLGGRPGRQFKGWLHHLYDEQLEGRLKTAEEAEAAALVLLKK